MKPEAEANGRGFNDIGVKCGFTAGAAAEQGANKNIAATAEIKELIYFIVVVLAKIKPEPFALISILTKILNKVNN